METCKHSSVTTTETDDRIEKECNDCSWSSSLPKRKTNDLQGPVAGWPK